MRYKSARHLSRICIGFRYTAVAVSGGMGSKTGLSHISVFTADSLVQKA